MRYEILILRFRSRVEGRPASAYNYCLLLIGFQPRTKGVLYLLVCTSAFRHAGLTASLPPLGIASRTPFPATRYTLAGILEAVTILKASLTAVRFLVSASSSSNLEPSMTSLP